jgi:hypothetical protein
MYIASTDTWRCDMSATNSVGGRLTSILRLESFCVVFGIQIMKKKFNRSSVFVVSVGVRVRRRHLTEKCLFSVCFLTGQPVVCSRIIVAWVFERGFGHGEVGCSMADMNGGIAFFGNRVGSESKTASLPPTT